MAFRFNEDSRVKIPAILHLIRLGYNFIRELPRVSPAGSTRGVTCWKLRLKSVSA